MTGDPVDLTDTLRRALESARFKPADGPGNPWVDHGHETATVRIQVRYLDEPPPPSLDVELGLQADWYEFETYLAIRPGANAQALVEAIVAAAPTLDMSTWPALYDRLVSLADSVQRVEGVDGEDSWAAGPGDHDKVLERYP